MRLYILLLLCLFYFCCEDLNTDPNTINKHYILTQLNNGLEVFGRKARLHLNKNHSLSKAEVFTWGTTMPEPKT